MNFSWNMAVTRPRCTRSAVPPKASVPNLGRLIGPLRRRTWAIAILAYSVLFYCGEIPTLSQAFRRPFRRFEIFVFALLPDQLLRQWGGENGQIGVLDRLPIIGAALLILISATVWGHLLVRTTKVDRLLRPLERFAISALVGLGLSSTVVLVLGLAGLLHSGWPFIWFGFPILVGGIRLTRRLARLQQPLGLARFKELAAKGVRRIPEGLGTASGIRGAIFFCATVLGVFLVLAAILPPTDFDVREYHLQAPKEFYQNGRIEFVPHNIYANMPLGAEMHALAGMVLTGDIRTGALVGKLVIATYAILGAILVGQAARRVGDQTAGAAAAAIFLGVPWVIAVSANGLVDVAFSVATFGSFFLLWLEGFSSSRDWASAPKGRLRSREGLNHSPKADPPTTSERRLTPAGLGSLLLAGFLAGTAAGMKYTGLVYALVPLGVLATAFFTPPKKPLSTWLSRAGFTLLIFLCGAFPACGGWYAKNLLFTGNPVYPLAYSLFGGTGWDAEKALRWWRVHSPPGFSLAAFAMDSLRILLTSEWHSGLVVAFAAVGILARPRPRGVGSAAFLVAWLFAIWWFLTHRIDRFWLPLLPFLCVFSGIGFTRASENRPGWTARIVFFVGLFWTFLVTASGAVAYNRYFAPLKELWEAPERIGQEHLLLNRLFSQAPAGSRLLTVGEAAVFDLQMPVLYATCFDTQPWEQITRGKTPEEIRRTLRDLRVAYVYVNWLEIARYRSPGNYGFTGYVQPDLFRELVRAGVLAPVLMPPGTPNQIFLVK